MVRLLRRHPPLPGVPVHRGVAPAARPLASRPAVRRHGRSGEIHARARRRGRDAHGRARRDARESVRALGSRQVGSLGVDGVGVRDSGCGLDDAGHRNDRGARATACRTRAGRNRPLVSSAHLHERVPGAGQRRTPPSREQRWRRRAGMRETDDRDGGSIAARPAGDAYRGSARPRSTPWCRSWAVSNRGSTSGFRERDRSCGSGWICRSADEGRRSVHQRTFAAGAVRWSAGIAQVGANQEPAVRAATVAAGGVGSSPGDRARPAVGGFV